jgi:hypothetical protein
MATQTEKMQLKEYSKAKKNASPRLIKDRE